MKYFEDVRFPDGCRGIIDVTKSPWFLDNSGREDCTEKLCALLDELMSVVVKEMKEVYETLQNSPEGTYLSRENRRINGRVLAIFPVLIDQLPTIYFPNGTYLVSDTISYTLRDLHNMMYHYSSGGFELNRCLRFMGQNRDKTVIRLQDNCKGFEWGQQRSVLDIMRGEKSNVAMSNYIENLTINIGRGNAGAAGIHFFANNSGMIRNVRVVSEDENHDGAVGILIDGDSISAANIHDVEVDGFRYGIKITSSTTNVHLERISLKNPQKYGISVGNVPVQIIGLKAEGDVPMVLVSGFDAHLTLIDAVMKSKGTSYTAIQYLSGCVFLRNIYSEGFAACYEENWFEKYVPDGYLEEYSNFGKFTLFDKAKKVELKKEVHKDPTVTTSVLLDIPDDGLKSINLKVPPLPDVERERCFENWACVNDYGAVGDGQTDDTRAIQAAFNSGKPVVWFQPGRYLLTSPVDIPDAVNHVHFMYADVRCDEGLGEAEGEGVFHINGDVSRPPLLIEKLFSWNQCTGLIRMFRHDGTRTVFFRDCHTQACAFYFNTVRGGEVFFENCACCIGDRKVYHAVKNFSFYGQKAWCHSINPERSDFHTLNDGGILWWSGFKTEQQGYIAYTENGGVTEILGGSTTVGAGLEKPLIYNENSDVCAIFCTHASHDFCTFPLAVREVRCGETKDIRDNELPLRVKPWYYVPFYIGRGKTK